MRVIRLVTTLWLALVLGLVPAAAQPSAGAQGASGDS